MKLSRRTVSLSIAGLCAGLTNLGFAQGKNAQEGIDYQQIKPRLAVSTAANKIELIEFFWYGCPHCNALEQPFHDWLKKQAPDVQFKRVHIDFGGRTEAHQRLFYTLEQMNLLDKHHTAVFTAIHGERKSLASKELILEWVKSRGIDAAAFNTVYNSFSMASKLKQAQALQTSFKVEGVPHFGIDGQYVTSPSMTGTMLNFFATLDALLAKVRKDRQPASKRSSTNKTIAAPAKK